MKDVTFFSIYVKLRHAGFHALRWCISVENRYVGSVMVTGTKSDIRKQSSTSDWINYVCFHTNVLKSIISYGSNVPQRTKITNSKRFRETQELHSSHWSFICPFTVTDPPTIYAGPYHDAEILNGRSGGCGLNLCNPLLTNSIHAHCILWKNDTSSSERQRRV